MASAASVPQKIFLGSSPSLLVIAVIITFVAAFVGYNMWIMSNTVPLPAIKEAFGGVAVGSGSPDCIRSSTEAAQLADFFNGREAKAEEGADDLREFVLILSKLCCFKKDLMGPSGVVEATRYQSYSTAHDIEPIGETTARCFAKTIPPRDLEISFDKWSVRGAFLVRRLCTAYEVKPEEYKMLSSTFEALLKDVKDVAVGACFTGTPLIAGKPQGRDPQGYQTNDLIDLGPYKGRY
jgi:hypothetical protein